MARRPGRDLEDGDADETPPWMEVRSTRPPRAAASREAAQPAHTLITWRALVIGAAIALIAAIGLVIGVRRMSTPDPASLAAANGEVPLIRAPATPYKTRVGGDAAATPAAAAAAAPGTDPAAAADPIGALAAGQDAPAAPPPAVPPPAARAPTDLMPRTAPANAHTDGPVDATADAPAPADLARPAETRPAPEPAPVQKAARAEKTTTVPKPAPARLPARPEKPVAKPRARPAASPDPAFSLPAEDAPAAKPRAGIALQLGAFSSREKAEAAWASAAAAHPELARLAHRIDPIERDGRTLYRLRATGPGSATLCATLKGAACVAR